MSRSLETIKKISEYIRKAKGFDQCMERVRIVSAGNGECKAEFTVEESQLNGGGTLHGGFTATLVDCVTTYALMTTKQGIPGVSINMNVSYLKAATPGEVVVVDAKTCRAGRTLAFLEAELYKKENGDLIARGQHTKFLQSGS